MDPRINLPNMWNYLNPECLLDGLDIAEFVNNPAAPLNFWLPDVTFYSATEISVEAELIKIFPNCTIFWSRHIIGTFPQPQMNYKRYPLDQQNFSIILQSFSFDSKIIQLTFSGGPAVVLLTQEGNSEPSVNLNQLWSYNSYSGFIYNQLIPSTYNPNRMFSTAAIYLNFNRQSLGRWEEYCSTKTFINTVLS